MTPARTISIRALLDVPRLGAFRLRVVLLCWLIAVLDGFDVQSMAFVAPVLSRLWNMPSGMMGQVLTAGLVGLMLGSVLLGRLSDRVGRRPVLLGSVVLVGLGSFATALSTTVFQLMLMRLVTGFGLGGVTVMSLALTAEYAPERSRATLVTAMYLGFPIGGSLGGLLATPLMVAFGWPAIFIVGGAMPLILSGCIWRLLPESLQFSVLAGVAPARIGAVVRLIDPDYTYAQGDRFAMVEQGARRAGVAELFARRLLPGTLLLWLICFANLLVLYLLINWLPSILNRSGLSLAMANLGAVAFNMGGVVGGLLIARAVDRLGAFRVLTAAYVLAALVIWLLARAASLEIAFALTMLAGAGVIGAQFCVNALAAAFYPTLSRSTGVGWALGFGRVGSIAGPLIGGVALGTGVAVATIFSSLAVPLLVCAVAVTLLGIAWQQRT